MKRYTDSELTDKMIEDLQERIKKGVNKYNSTLDENNRDDMIQHAYEEALDLAQYLKKEMSVIPLIQKLMAIHHDNESLGEEIRKIFNG